MNDEKNQEYQDGLILDQNGSKQYYYSYPTLDISPNHYLPLFFEPSSSPIYSNNNSYTMTDINLSKMIITYWVNFATYG